MTHLSAEEAADRAQCRALVFQHPVKGQDRTVATNDPEYTEPAQRIDRYDAVGLQGERHIYVTHRAQVAISSKALAAMTPLLRSAVTGLVPRHCYRGHFFVTRAGRFLGTEIVPPDERLVIAAPERTVIQSLHASERNCKNRAFHVALLRVKIWW